MGKQADSVNAKFGALKVAALGAMAAMGGIALVGATVKLAEYGNKLAEVQSRLRQMGVSAANVSNLTNAAFTQSMRTPNVDYADSLSALMKTRTVLGSSKEAVAAAPYVVRTEGVLTNWGMGGPTALAELLKSIELRGGTYGPDGKTFSVAALRKNLTDALAAQNIAGKLLTPNVIMRTTKLAGPASQLMSGWSWWSSMAEAAQQMGPGAGRGFAMALKEFSGGPMSRLYAYNLQKYGLAKASGFIHIPHTFQTALKPDALKGSSVLYGQGLFPWVQKVLVPTLEAHGVHGKKALLAAVYQTISSQTGSRLVANMITNALSYVRTSKQMQQSMGVSIYGTQMSQSMNAPMKAFHGAFESFLMTIGRPLVPIAVKILNSLTHAVIGITKWAKIHPAMVAKIVEGVAVLGAALIVLGTGAVIGALVALGGIPALIGAGVAAVVDAVAIIAFKFHEISHWFMGLGRYFGELNNWLANLSHTINHFLEHPLSGIGHAFRAAANDFVNGNHAATPMWHLATPAVPAYGGRVSGNPLEPHHVIIDNPHHIAHAIKHGIAASLSANQHGTTGFNGRASAHGSPAFTSP